MIILQNSALREEDCIAARKSSPDITWKRSREKERRFYDRYYLRYSLVKSKQGAVDRQIFVKQLAAVSRTL
jgi:hypothetical protein